MLNFIQIMVGLLSDGALPTIKKVHTTVVRLVSITLEMQNQMKRNAIYGFIAPTREDAILQIYMNTNIRSAG